MLRIRSCMNLSQWHLPHLSRAVITAHAVQPTKLCTTEQSWPIGSGHKIYLKINMAGIQVKSKNTMVAQVSTSNLNR